jgi:antagonist of KipI
MLYERTIGGYARIARVARADLDRLAHLKPGDYVLFERIEMDEAERLWEDRQIKNKTAH